MAIPKITGSGPNSRTNLKNIHSGERSFQKDLSTTHSQISLMQQALTSLGYNTKGTDGIFGDNTASAVKSFQRACSLTADGYFGKNSLLNLEKLLGHHLDPDADGCGDTGSSGSGDSGSGDNGSGDSGGSSSSDSTIQVGDTVITTKTGVNFRQTPNGAPHMQVKKGTTMKVTDIKDDDRYTWYEGTIDGNIGYLRGDCVEKYTGSSGGSSNSGGSSSSGGNTGSSNDFTDIVTTTPTVNTYYTYSIDDAVKYAEEHSTTLTSSSELDPKRNKSFKESPSRACANFVYQCLLAGGARMFDGWCFKLSGIPSSWSDSAWTKTNQGRRRLLEKGWICRINKEEVQRGDIIYTYNKDATPTPFKHVTIAVSDYIPSKQACEVCGHTLSQNHELKPLTPQKNGNEAYCYHVLEQLGGDGTEKAIDLTNNNSKAI